MVLSMFGNGIMGEDLPMHWAKVNRSTDYMIECQMCEHHPIPCASFHKYQHFHGPFKRPNIQIERKHRNKWAKNCALEWI